MGSVYVKRNFLASKFPSETISGAIFVEIINSIVFQQRKALGHLETRSITTKTWGSLPGQGGIKESVCMVGGRYNNPRVQCRVGWGQLSLAHTG